MTDTAALDNRIALVAGGAHGLGLGIVEQLLAAGAQVAVCDRTPRDTLPAGSRFFTADIRDAAEVDDLVTAVVDHFGRLDIAVTNAGGSPVADAATASPAFSTAIVTLNLLAPLHVATAANRVMQGQDDGGAIVNLAALSGTRPAPGTAAYGAAKAGLINLTQSLAVEWAPKVRVNTVTFGSIALDAEAGGTRPEVRVPLGRQGDPADVAAAVLHLAGPASAYVTGSNLVVHGGPERPAYLAALTGG